MELRRTRVKLAHSLHLLALSLTGTQLMDMPHQVVCVLLATIALIIYRHTIRRKTLPLPPGPKERLVSGHVHQLPRTEPYKAYKEWSTQFSPSLPFISELVFTKVSSATVMYLQARLSSPTVSMPSAHSSLTHTKPPMISWSRAPSSIRTGL